MTITLSARVAAVAGAAALTLVACAPGSETPESPEPDSTMSATHDAMDKDDEAMEKDDDSMEKDDEAMESDEPVDVPEQLEFETVLLDGTDFSGADLAGKDSLLWVWAPWCPVCQAEAPEIEEASHALPEGVTLYGLPGRADAASSQAFVENYDLGHVDHIFTEDGSLWANFGVAGQPALVLINDDGTVEAIPGAMSMQGIIDAAEELANT